VRWEGCRGCLYQASTEEAARSYYHAGSWFASAPPPLKAEEFALTIFGSTSPPRRKHPKILVLLIRLAPTLGLPGLVSQLKAGPSRRGQRGRRGVDGGG